MRCPTPVSRVFSGDTLGRALRAPRACAMVCVWAQSCAGHAEGSGTRSRLGQWAQALLVSFRSGAWLGSESGFCTRGAAPGCRLRPHAGPCSASPSFSPGALCWASASSPEGEPKPVTAGRALARDGAGAADPPRDSTRPMDGPSGAPGSRGPAAEGTQGPGPTPAGTCCGVCVRAEAHKARAGEGRPGAGGPSEKFWSRDTTLVA